MLAINCMPDHVHVFIGYNLNKLTPDLVRDIKVASNDWIQNNNLSKFKFEWQSGYGAFTYSRSQVDSVVKYILNQEEHHKKNEHLEKNILIC